MESDSLLVPKKFISEALQENENVCAQLDEEREAHIQSIKDYQGLELDLRAGWANAEWENVKSKMHVASLQAWIKNKWTFSRVEIILLESVCFLFGYLACYFFNANCQ